MKVEDLPEKPSALLRLAVNDAKAVRRRKNTTLDMRAVASVRADGLCHACMAGAVMLRSLGMKPDPVSNDDREYSGNLSCSELYGTGDYPTPFQRIDAMREGYFHYNTPGATPEQSSALAVAARKIRDRYDERLGRAPWPVYLEAAEILEAVGL